MLHAGLVVDDDELVLGAELVENAPQQIVDGAVARGSFRPAHRHQVEFAGLDDRLLQAVLERPHAVHASGVGRLGSRLLANVGHRRPGVCAKRQRQARVGVRIDTKDRRSLVALAKYSDQHGGDRRLARAAFAADCNRNSHNRVS
jgi:hypothetical protein